VPRATGSSDEPRSGLDGNDEQRTRWSPGESGPLHRDRSGHHRQQRQLGVAAPPLQQVPHVLSQGDGAPKGRSHLLDLQPEASQHLHQLVGLITVPGLATPGALRTLQHRGPVGRRYLHEEQAAGPKSTRHGRHRRAVVGYLHQRLQGCHHVERRLAQRPLEVPDQVMDREPLGPRPAAASLQRQFRDVRGDQQPARMPPSEPQAEQPFLTPCIQDPKGWCVAEPALDRVGRQTEPESASRWQVSQLSRSERPHRSNGAHHAGHLASRPRFVQSTTVTDQVARAGAVRVLGGAADDRLGRWLDRGDHLLGGLRPLVGPQPQIVVGVEDGAATDGSTEAMAEAAAVRLRRTGAEPRTVPVRGPVRTRGDLVALCRRRGRDSVLVWRTDPSLLPELQLGGWYIADWRGRLARGVGLAARVPAAWLPPRLAADLAFWRGVHEAATDREWRRLTTSSYVVLCYHRLQGEAVPGQERMDVAPSALRGHLRILRLLGWRALSPEALESFHADPGATLPRRRFVLTADDGFVEAVRELTPLTRHHPLLFAVTGSVGGTADWLAQAPLADWGSLGAFDRAGGTVGSHARRHVRLDTLDDREIEAELSESLAELRARLAPALPVLAYPHGAHDARVRAQARRVGYALAFTTRQGRNGAGTDRWCLRRVEPKIWDSRLAFLWKVLTGVSPPPRWERRLESRWRAGRERRARES
jgi:peptidoglycan/xylan/chitin deacetylase (PgdA/CDA1 family)